MKSVEEYAASYREAVHAAVPNEQVLSVGVLSRPGSMGSVLLMRVTFHLGDGSTFQLDSNRSVGQYNKLNDGFFATLGATTTQ